MGEVKDPRLHRHVCTARLMVENGGEAEPPILRDMHFVYSSSDMWVLGGIEQHDDGIVVIEYAQTWILCEPRGDVAAGSIGPPFRG